MTDPKSPGTPPIRRYTGDGRWTDTALRPYKEEGSLFRNVTRQNLFDDPDLACQWRYFEVGAGGHSTLERHQHVHAVMVARGRGRVLLGDRIDDIGPFDLIHIPANTWHQFRAGNDEPLGFLCLVNHHRDRPELPDAGDLERLRKAPDVAAFIRV